MALNFAAAAPLKPEIRLGKALKDFEASLSDGQKLTFQTRRTQTMKSPPSTKDVMRLTAEINSSRKVGERCFGPRFSKFLHGAQEFAAIGDVVVGSSQNVAACGVWTVIRMTLLVRVRLVHRCCLRIRILIRCRGLRTHSSVLLALQRSI